MVLACCKHSARIEPFALGCSIGKLKRLLVFFLASDWIIEDVGIQGAANSHVSQGKVRVRLQGGLPELHGRLVLALAPKISTIYVLFERGKGRGSDQRERAVLFPCSEPGFSQPAADLRSEPAQRRQDFVLILGRFYVRPLGPSVLRID